MSTSVSDSTVVWKPIPGYEQTYEVSNDGQVRSIRSSAGRQRGKIRTPQKDRNGYLFVSLQQSSTRRNWPVHRLVLLAFCGRPHGRECNHINGIKDDNRLENLEYVSHQENIIHSYQHLKRNVARGERAGASALTEASVRQIITMLSEGMSQNEIAKEFCVSHVAIGAIARGETWKHIERGEVVPATPKGENCTNSKLTEADVIRIRELYISGVSTRKIANQYGISHAAVSNIITGRTWKHVQQVDMQTAEVK